MRRHSEEPESEPESELPAGHPLRWTTLDDPFVALDPELMAELTPEQQAARAVHDDPDDSVLIAVAAEAERLKRIRVGEVSPAELDDLDPDDNTPAARYTRQTRWAAYRRRPDSGDEEPR